jgi:ABC-type nitrate/sulfonate/bicarbonate transport system substrate-binding protein
MPVIRILWKLAPGGLALLLSACGASAPATSSAGRASFEPASAAPVSGAPSSAAASAKPAASGASSAAASGQPQARGQFSGGDPNGPLVRVSYASPAVSTTPYYAALAQGFFAQQHIRITQYMMPPSVSITALSKGEIDMTDSPSNAIEGATRGLPFKVIYSAWQRSPWTLIGKPQYKTIQDLRGKTIGTNQAGSTPYIYLQQGLKKAGMTINDVKIVSSGGTIITYQNLIGGQVDAAVVSPPFDAQGELAGFHEIQFLGDLLELPYIGAGSSVPFLSAHHDETVRFLKAMIAANRWIKNHPSETANLIVQYIGTPPDAAKISAEKMIPNLWQDNFEASPTGLQQALDIQAETTGEKINITPDQLVDYGPLQEALRGD